MTPPVGENALPGLSSTFSSLNPANQQNTSANDEWLSLDSNHGFIRLYDPNDASSSSYSRSKLVPCTMWTTVEQICLRLNNDLNPRSWYVQLNGDRVRHLRPDERPLFIQHNYLLTIGFSSIQRLQDEGDKHDLGYLVRFLTGDSSERESRTVVGFGSFLDRLMIDPKIQPRSLSTLAWIRKGKLIRKWIKRKCVISSSRLTVYPGLCLMPIVREC